MARNGAGRSLVSNVSNGCMLVADRTEPVSYNVEKVLHDLLQVVAACDCGNLRVCQPSWMWPLILIHGR